MATKNEAQNKAHVHVVIIGFSMANISKASECRIYHSDGRIDQVNNINSYLRQGPNILIKPRTHPICSVAEMETGNRPADGGNLLLSEEEYQELISKEPGSKKWVKKLTGAKEFIQGKKRYCLWLVGISPAELRRLPLIMQRVEQCKKDRLKGAKDRQKLAEIPWLFREQKNPSDYLIFPRVSSHNRDYVPIGYLGADTIPTDAATIVTDASKYEFGILSSNVSMAWTRAVAGRLKSDYRYGRLQEIT